MSSADPSFKDSVSYIPGQSCTPASKTSKKEHDNAYGSIRPIVPYYKQVKFDKKNLRHSQINKREELLDSNSKNKNHFYENL